MIDRKGLPSAKRQAQSRVSRARAEMVQQVASRNSVHPLHVGSESLELYVLRALSAEQRLQVKKHLAQCADCRVEALETQGFIREFKEEVFPRSLDKVVALGAAKLREKSGLPRLTSSGRRLPGVPGDSDHDTG